MNHNAVLVIVALLLLCLLLLLAQVFGPGELAPQARCFCGGGESTPQWIALSRGHSLSTIV